MSLFQRSPKARHLLNHYALMPADVVSFQCVRARAHAFCQEREWQNFHTPVNLALALSGECGEISEIFQWKGPLDKGTDYFTAKEKEHIGEEIADVLIYSTRLCDVCGIDLAYSVRHCASVTSSLRYSKIESNIMFENTCSSTGINSCDMSDKWDKLNFAELESLMPEGLQSPVSPRALALSIQSRCGQACELFLNKSESHSTIGLPDWPRSDVAELALLIGSICLLLSRLAKFSNKSLSKCVTDKFLKNEAKYPAEMVKGSSAKYTAYADSIKSKIEKNVDRRSIFFSAAATAAVALIGYFVGVRRASLL